VRGGIAHNSSKRIAAEIKQEIAHVLFIDIVAYSKMAINEQKRRNLC
jgi:hypothetical protein